MNYASPHCCWQMAFRQPGLPEGKTDPHDARIGANLLEFECGGPLTGGLLSSLSHITFWRMKRRPNRPIQVSSRLPLEAAELVDYLVDLFFPCFHACRRTGYPSDVDHPFGASCVKRSTLRSCEVGSATRPDRPDAGCRHHGETRFP